MKNMISIIFALTATGLLVSYFAGAETINTTPSGSGSSTAGVSSLATSCPGGVAINPSTGAVTLGLQTATRTATDPPASPINVNTDCGSIIYLNSATDRSPVLADPSGTGFPAGWATLLCNINAAQTLTPTAGTIGGAGTKVLGAGTASSPVCLGVISNGTNNYQLESFASPVVITAASTATSGFTDGDLISSSSSKTADSGIPAANVITKVGGGTLASNAVTAMTCPGTAASSVGAVTCVVDYQLFAAGTSGNWTKPTGNYTVTRVFGCGAGGSGGSGPIIASGTAASGGGGGGGGDCSWVDFKTADLAGTVAYSVAGTTAGGLARSQTTTIVGLIGAQGANTTFGSTLHTWYGGGGGQAGLNASTTTGGGGGGPFAAGANQSVTGQCQDGGAATGNGGVTGGVSVGWASRCSSGGGGTSATGVGSAAGYSGAGASGGGSGGGFTTGASAQPGGAGGLALGCQAAGASPAGTAGGITPAVATQPFGYQPGCGGGGGGGNVTATGATGASGAAGSGPGAGGGGGGAVLVGTPANTSGAGGAGGGGVLIVISF